MRLRAARVNRRFALAVAVIISRSHALRGNALADALRPALKHDRCGLDENDAERRDARSHAERGNEKASQQRFKRHAAGLEDFFRGAEAVVEGFFEESHAAQIGVGEVNRAERA